MNYLINDFDFITKTGIETEIENKNKNLTVDLEKMSKKLVINDTVIIKSILSKINIHKLLKKLVKIFESKIILADKKIKIKLEIGKNVPEIIKSSLDKITQILFNLLSNSMKFTKNGFISINLNCLDENKLEFNIYDTGIGIKEDFKKNIFRPFCKLKENKHNIYGMGLGLYIVKLHIEKLKGSIIIESQEDKYTSIKFVICFEKNENFIQANIKYQEGFNPKGNLYKRDQILKLNKNDSVKKFNNKQKKNLNDLIENENKKILTYQNSVENCLSINKSPRFILDTESCNNSISRNKTYKKSSNINYIYNQLNKVEENKKIFKTQSLFYDNLNQFNFSTQIGGNGNKKSRNNYLISTILCDKTDKLKKNINRLDLPRRNKTLIDRSSRFDLNNKFIQENFNYNPIRRQSIQKGSEMSNELSRIVTKNFDNNFNIEYNNLNDSNFIFNHSPKKLLYNTSINCEINSINQSFNKNSVYTKIKKEKNRLSYEDQGNIIENKEYFYNQEIECLKILVVDDEKLIRQSNSNLIRKFFKNKKIKVQIFECEDGFECLNMIYQGKLKGINFDYILTDQTMNYITGTILSEILHILIDNKIINYINIYLLTSYSSSLFEKIPNQFLKVFSKPLIFEHLEFIFFDLEN